LIEHRHPKAFSGARRKVIRSKFGGLLGTACVAAALCHRVSRCDQIQTPQMPDVPRRPPSSRSGRSDRAHARGSHWLVELLTIEGIIGIQSAAELRGWTIISSVLARRVQKRRRGTRGETMTSFRRRGVSAVQRRAIAACDLDRTAIQTCCTTRGTCATYSVEAEITAQERPSRRFVR